MKKDGIGVGSASIVLVFAVLCLTVFSLITYVVARNDKSLVDAEARLVAGYYEADALAEQIVAEIMASDQIPESINGVEINKPEDLDPFAEMSVVYFLCLISEQKSLYVRLAVYHDTYDVLSWHMIDTDEWVFDDRLMVWQGSEDYFGFDDPMNAWANMDMWDTDD